MPLTYGGPSLAPRAGVALVLAVLIHLSAWQTLAGIRVFLPRREPPPPMIDVALLPPPQTPIPLPAPPAVVRGPPAQSRGPTSVEATPRMRGFASARPPKPQCDCPARGAGAGALRAHRRGPRGVGPTRLRGVRTGAGGRPGPPRAAAPAPEARTQQPVPASGQTAA